MERNRNKHNKSFYCAFWQLRFRPTQSQMETSKFSLIRNKQLRLSEWRGSAVSGPGPRWSWWSPWSVLLLLDASFGFHGSSSSNCSLPMVHIITRWVCELSSELRSELSSGLSSRLRSGEGSSYTHNCLLSLWLLHVSALQRSLNLIRLIDGKSLDLKPVKMWGDETVWHFYFIMQRNS